MDRLELDKIKKKYSSDIGSFVIIDYRVLEGVKNALGELIEITEDGKLKIRHVKNLRQRWEIDPDFIINYSVRPLRRVGVEK